MSGAHAKPIGEALKTWTAALSIAGFVGVLMVQWGVVITRVGGVERQIGEVLIELRSSAERQERTAGRLSFIEGRLQDFNPNGKSGDPRR